MHDGSALSTLLQLTAGEVRPGILNKGQQVFGRHLQAILLEQLLHLLGMLFSRPALNHRFALDLDKGVLELVVGLDGLFERIEGVGVIARESLSILVVGHLIHLKSL